MSAANPTLDAAVPDLDADSRTNEAWHARFARAEIQELLRVSDLRGLGSVALDWAIIAASFALVARRTRSRSPRRSSRSAAASSASRC